MKPLSRIVVATLGLIACALLAAGCSDLGAGGLDGPMETAEAAPGPGNGELTISNWPAYIDKNTVAEFEEATGISVDYIEDVNDNTEFFSKLQPTLQNRDPAGRSIFVVTDWMANKMHNLGYLQKFDQKSVAPAMANLVPSLQSPSFDPNREFSLPWQSGMTGLVVNTAEAPDVKSVNDLFDTSRPQSATRGVTYGPLWQGVQGNPHVPIQPIHLPRARSASRSQGRNSCMREQAADAGGLRVDNEPARRRPALLRQADEGAVLRSEDLVPDPGAAPRVPRRRPQRAGGDGVPRHRPVGGARLRRWAGVPRAYAPRSAFS